MIPAHMIPGWLSDAEIRAIHQVGRAYLDADSWVLEIGSFLGRSTAAWTDSGARVACVDPWAGSLAEWRRLCGCMDGCLSLVNWDADCVRPAFDALMRGRGHRIEAHQRSSTGFAWPHDDPPALIFIDGDHSFEGIAHDLDAAYHRWSLDAYEEPGAVAPIIMGHDLDNPHLPQIRHAVEGFADAYNFDLVRLPHTSLFWLEHRDQAGVRRGLDLEF